MNALTPTDYVGGMPTLCCSSCCCCCCCCCCCQLTVSYFRPSYCQLVVVPTLPDQIRPNPHALFVCLSVCYIYIYVFAICAFGHDGLVCILHLHLHFVSHADLFSSPLFLSSQQTTKSQHTKHFPTCLSNSPIPQSPNSPTIPIYNSDNSD